MGPGSVGGTCGIFVYVRPDFPTPNKYEIKEGSRIHMANLMKNPGTIPLRLNPPSLTIREMI